LPIVVDQLATNSRSDLRRTLVYLTSVVAGQGLGFLVLPIATRNLTTTEFGQYSLVLALASFVSVLGPASLRNIAFRYYFDARDAGTSAGLVASVAVVQVSLFAVLFTTAVMVTARISHGLAPVGTLVSAGVAATFGELYALLANVIRAEQEEVRYMLGEVATGAIRLVCSAGAFAAGFRTPSAIFQASAIGAAVGLAIIVPGVVDRINGPYRISLHAVTSVGRTSLVAMPLAIGGWLNSLVDRFVLRYFNGTGAVGLYSAAYSAADRAITTTGQAVLLMGWPAVLAAWHGPTPSEAVPALRRAMRLYFWFTVGPLIIATAWPRQLLVLVAGSPYGAAGGVLRIVALSSWLSGLTTYVNRPLELRMRYGTMSGVVILGGVVNLGLNLLLDPIYGLDGAAWSTLASYGIMLLLFAVLTERRALAVPWADLSLVVAAAGVGVAISSSVTSALIPRVGLFACLYLPVLLVRLMTGDAQNER
jgi:O-antigen/teichoic acid export membrane protein